MHKLCIYRDPGSNYWICQDLTIKNNNTVHKTINQLVNERFANYRIYLENKYSRQFANDKLNFIKGYLRNWFKDFQVQWIDFPGDLRDGKVTEKIHPLLTLSNLFFNY